MSPAPYGVVATGFNPKTYDEVKAELDEDLAAVYGTDMLADPQSEIGKLSAIFSEAFVELWQLAQACSDALNPTAATGTQLDNLSALTGTVRAPASRSEVSVTFIGSGGTVVPIGRILSVPGTGAQFETLAGTTVGGAAVVARALEYGPVRAPAGTVFALDTPVSGVTGATNALDAALGALIQSDAGLRFRRQLELAGSGSLSPDAIRAALVKVDGVLSARVFVNATSSVGVDGSPPHSVHAVVNGGADAPIREALFRQVGAGIETFGSTAGTVADATGKNQPVAFSRPVPIDVWIHIPIIADPVAFPVDGVATIEAAVADYGDAIVHTGVDIIPSVLVPVVFGAVPGVLGVGPVLVGLANPPVSTAKLVIGPTQITAFDTARISVAVTYDSL